jgi:hypothetical protein
MADPDRTIFLSYRRNVSWKLAYAVRYDLEKHGFDVFMDTKNLGGGEFAWAILRAIEERAHFLVLVEPPTLLRIAELDDWLRREIAHALAHCRNVVPLLVDGAKLPPAAKLPADIARLSLLNAVETVNGGHFPEVMQKLRTQFLRAGPPSASSHRARATRPPVGVEPCDEDVSAETVVGPTLDPSRPAPEWAEVTPLGGAARLG